MCKSYSYAVLPSGFERGESYSKKRVSRSPQFFADYSVTKSFMYGICRIISTICWKYIFFIQVSVDERGVQYIVRILMQVNSLLE